MDIEHDVPAIHKNGFVAQYAQCHVQDSPLLDPFLQAGFVRHSKQELKGLGGDAILRVIQEQSHRFGRHALAAFRVGEKKFPKMQRPGLFGVRLQRLPGRAFGQGLIAVFIRALLALLSAKSWVTVG